MEVRLPAPGEPLSENRATGNGRGAAMRRYRLLDPWKALGLVAGRLLIPTWREHHPEPTPVTVLATLAFRANRRRDPHNYVGTNVKALVDGLVRAGLIPDDNPEWATILEPHLVVISPPNRLECLVEIRPREDHQP